MNNLVAHFDPAVLTVEGYSAVSHRRRSAYCCTQNDPAASLDLLALLGEVVLGPRGVLLLIKRPEGVLLGF